MTCDMWHVTHDVWQVTQYYHIIIIRQASPVLADLPPANSILTFLHSYIPTFLYSYIPTLLHFYILTFLHSYIPTFLNSYISTFPHSYIHTFIHSNIPTFIHVYIPTFLYSYIPSSIIHHPTSIIHHQSFIHHQSMIYVKKEKKKKISLTVWPTLVNLFVINQEETMCLLQFLCCCKYLSLGVCLAGKFGGARDKYVIVLMSKSSFP